jgi:hypothetical protein
MHAQPRTPAFLSPFVPAAVTAAALLAGSTIAFAQQETAYPAVPTADDIRQARLERLARMDVLTADTVPSNPALEQAATSEALSSDQRQTMLRSIDTMDLRLDHTTAMLDGATGAQCNNALLAVVQKLSNQVAQMRQAMLAPERATTFDGVGAQAIFITPSSQERRENWRRQQLEQAAAYAGYPQASTSPVER